MKRRLRGGGRALRGNGEHLLPLSVAGYMFQGKKEADISGTVENLPEDGTIRVPWTKPVKVHQKAIVPRHRLLGNVHLLITKGLVLERIGWTRRMMTTRRMMKRTTVRISHQDYRLPNPVVRHLVQQFLTCKIWTSGKVRSSFFFLYQTSPC